MDLQIGPEAQVLMAIPGNLWHDQGECFFADFDHTFGIVKFRAKVGGGHTADLMLLILSLTSQGFVPAENTRMVLFETKYFPRQTNWLESLSRKDVLCERRFCLECPEMASLGPKWVIERDGANDVVVRASQEVNGFDSIFSLKIGRY